MLMVKVAAPLINFDHLIAENSQEQNLTSSW